MASQTMRGLAPELASLDETIWGLLVRATRDRRAEFRWMNLATVAATGQPSVRTVVLRAAAPSARALEFHTDRRSAKVDELGRHGLIAVHFHDRRAGLQVRAGGAVARLDDAARATAWQALHPQARTAYAQAVAPGTVVPAPDAVAVAAAPEDGFANFDPYRITITELEWLDLAREGHRRARFAYDCDGQVTLAQWLAP